MSTGNKPDFSNVQGGASSTEAARPDFSNVQGGVRSTGEVAGEQTWEVQKGDSLSKIAKRFYGDANAWPRIFEANRDQISDPDRIHPGQVLRIPPAG
ncbi:LysM peptidoglycan-binding domain-containing protein [Pseudoxanthomonas taiwanensis]|jgi:Uncharacterized protein containing LysM domain|uniref:Potassium binding protein Kbp n=1 Tax=Pseudoxanthomonas taiwanensis TaxID=176598 RepID=A0A921NU49_9GAMM|nr:LysM peptidoglycan-binding domain-containing protein [Pseudoxanthomonas taiwanensis]KAF1689410.1 peptidoglycan-binding protein LysM [Pseudoxanthomonas taiwanensis]MBO2467736.1 peptidoglycan-binding protein LysM [Xanthomonadaceae bacterium]